MRIFLYILIAISLVACAQVKTPTGGSKDTEGPEITVSYPSHLQTNYKAKSIAITFNELVSLTDAKNNIVITPPLKNKPDIYLKKGETLVISFNDTLQENTTYSINLGEAISDYNESNPLVDNLLVFSTGDIVDSLSFSGRVTLGENDTPCEGCKVMLYRENEDSIVFKERPYYFVKTDESGAYNLNFLKEGKYKMLALLDENNDFLFDPEQDLIGFRDSLMNVAYDTITVSHNMSVFKQKPSLQSLRSSKLVGDKKLQLVFALPVQNLSILIDSVPLQKDKFISIYNDERDTVDLWLTEPEKKNTEWKLTILDDDVELENTSIFFNGEKSKLRSLSPKNNGISKISLTDSILVKWSSPIDSFNEEKFTVKRDSSILAFNIDQKDNFTLEITLDAAVILNEQDNVTIKLDSMAVRDIYGSHSDSLGHLYKIQEEIYFGNLLITLDSNVTKRLAILTSEKGSKTWRKKIDVNGKINFNGLEPGDYSLFILDDQNQNGKWDTGNYLLKKQPEKVNRHPGIITIRSNWDLELDLSQ